MIYTLRERSASWEHDPTRSPPARAPLLTDGRSRRPASTRPAAHRWPLPAPRVRPAVDPGGQRPGSGSSWSPAEGRLSCRVRRGRVKLLKTRERVFVAVVFSRLSGSRGMCVLSLMRSCPLLAPSGTVSRGAGSLVSSPGWAALESGALAGVPAAPCRASGAEVAEWGAARLLPQPRVGHAAGAQQC